MTKDLRTRIAETLAQHAYASVEMGKGIDGGFFFVCECEHREVKTAAGKRDWLADHQAQVLEPLIAEAQRDAVTRYAAREPATFKVEFTNQSIFDRAFQDAKAEAWREGVSTALNHAILNDDGITLRLEHLDGRPWTNPYRSDDD